jgi:hypothetical protein
MDAMKRRSPEKTLSCQERNPLVQAIKPSAEMNLEKLSNAQEDNSIFWVFRGFLNAVGY